MEQGNTRLIKGLELLRDLLSSSNNMSADNGTYSLTAFGTKTGEYKGVFIPNTATISNLQINGDSTNIVTTYIDFPTTALEGGTYITPAKGSVFTSITTTAGAIVLLNK